MSTDYNSYVDPLEAQLHKLTEEREEHMLDMLEEMGQQFFGGPGGGGGTRNSISRPMLNGRRRQSNVSVSPSSTGGGNRRPKSFTKQLPQGSGGSSGDKREKRGSGRQPKTSSSPPPSIKPPSTTQPSAQTPVQEPAGRAGKRKSILFVPNNQRRQPIFFGGSAAGPPDQDEEIEPSLPFPSGIETLSLNFDLIYTFFDKDAHRELQRNLEGYEPLDIKGLLYWKERLKKYVHKLDMLKNLIQVQLDEKRNFMSFMLTIITTVLAPLTIITGYFGMNFDNMVELDSTTYPLMPGVYIMWFTCVIVYGLLVLAAFHFRVIYSAT